MQNESMSLPLAYANRMPNVTLRRPPLLVLLHGIGSNEHEFLKFAQSFDERLAILSVRAPFAQTAGSFLWFNLERVGGNAYANVAQAEHSRGQMIRFIREAVRLFKIDPSQVYLMGHSQGAVLAFNVLLTEPELVTGLIVFNGQVLPEIRPLIVSPERLRGKRILMMHGLQDSFYPISLARASNAFLSTQPVALEYYEFYSGHHLTSEGLTKASDWLVKRLDEAGIVATSEKISYETRLSTVHLKVRNLERSIVFYVRVFGMRLVERTGRSYAFLTNTDAHHVIALQNVGPDAPLPLPEFTGLYRVGFAVPNQLAFARAYKALKDLGVEVSAVDHLVRWALHFRDPDGNGLEIYWDTRDQPGKADLWQGRDLPLVSEQILSVLEQAEINTR